MFSARTIVSIAISLALAAGAGFAVKPEAGAPIKAAARQVTAKVDAASRAALSTMIDSEAGVSVDTSGQVETGTQALAETDAPSSANAQVHSGANASLGANAIMDPLSELGVQLSGGSEAEGGLWFDFR